MRSIIPRPDKSTTALFENTNRNSLLFLRAARIEQGSKKHKDLKATIQALQQQYLHPFKYVEEQSTDRVDSLIARAQITLPWLGEYEDSWPARIYLKRYVDTKRPHLMRSRYAHAKARGQPSQNTPKKFTENACIKDPVILDSFTVRDFLASLTPSLEHHLDAFLELGIKDRATLHAFLSWPQPVQAQFLDESQKVLHFTGLERRALLVDCGLLSQKALQRSHIP